VDHATPQQSKEVLGLTPKQMCLKIQQRFGLGSGDLPTSSSFQAVQA
jgi:1-deoxy-D-xylulose-5-phosphate synthase